MTTMTAASKYIMDDPREGQRLLDKADAGSWIAKFLAPHLPHIRSILSVGCGPGVFLREIAEANPGVEVVGVDLSDKRIADAQQRLRGLPNARAYVGSALELPFDASRFDLVFSRFLVEYLPNKPLAVREMKRVCSVGGKVMLQDLDGQLVWHYPEEEELQQITERVVKALAKTGFDPFVGRKLFSLCLGSGLTDVNVQIDPYHLYAGVIDDANHSQWRTKLEIALPQIAAVVGSNEAAKNYTDRFLAYLKNPNTLTYSCLFTVTGTKHA
jgi:ubiquinone/menaquinone biosynthesis C-methylase UbiE